MASLAEKLAAIATEEPEEMVPRRVTPSWFPPPPDATVEDLAARYRQRAQERVATRRAVPPPLPENASPPPRGGRLTGVALAGLAAMLVGGASGFALSHKAEFADLLKPSPPSVTVETIVPMSPPPLAEATTAATLQVVEEPPPPPQEIPKAAAAPSVAPPAPAAKIVTAPPAPPVVQPGQALTPAPVAPEPVIVPAAAPAGAADLMAKGNRLLDSGDLTAARSFFEQAFAQGAAEGALGVAKTYDPAVYARLKVQGLAPDAAQALAWYQKAAKAGAAEAAPAITALQGVSQ